MNRTLLLSIHGLVAILVVGGLAALALTGRVTIGRAPQGQRDYLLWTGWIALALFLAAYAYVLRKYAHKLGYSPEFRRQVPRNAMDQAEQRLGVLRDRIAAKTLTDRSQILDAARAILRETGCGRVLVVRVANDAAGRTALFTQRTEPLARTARWLHAHVYYGLGAGILTFGHGGGRFDTPMGIALNGLTLVVVLTGLVGLGFWLVGPGWLTKEERDLSIEEAFVLDRHYTRRVEAEAARLSEKDPTIAAAISKRESAPDLLPRLAAALAPAADAERRAREVLTLVGQRRRVSAELARLQRVKFAMNAWRLVHVPASIVLLAVITAHILSIWLY